MILRLILTDMEKIPEKSLKCGLSIPVFGMGTWMMGGDAKRNENDNGEAAATALRCGLERGLRHIDTAEMYAEGFSEEITGRAIAGWARKDIFLTSKVWSSNLDFDGVLRAAEKSLKRLKTDYLDLYLIHKPNDEFPMSETFRAMNRLADEKIIKHIGVSNFSVPRLKLAQSLSERKITVNQIHYNLIYRQPEADRLVEYALDNDIMLIAWRPLQKGAISEAEILKKLAAKYHKTAAQVALNWVISQPNTVTLSTMRNPEHIVENIGALDWRLDNDDVEMLRRHFPGQKMVSDAVPLL